MTSKEPFLSIRSALSPSDASMTDEKPRPFSISLQFLLAELFSSAISILTFSAIFPMPVPFFFSYFIFLSASRFGALL